MTRCEAKHPLTQEQCVAEAGHAAPHDLPSRAERPLAEKQAQIMSINADLHALLPAWAAKGFPPEAMIAECMHFAIACARAAGMPEKTLVQSFLGMSGPADMPVNPSAKQCIAYVASVLLGVDVIQMRAEDVPRPSPESQPS